MAWRGVASAAHKKNSASITVMCRFYRQQHNVPIIVGVINPIIVYREKKRCEVLKARQLRAAFCVQAAAMFLSPVIEAGRHSQRHIFPNKRVPGKRR